MNEKMSPDTLATFTAIKGMIQQTRQRLSAELNQSMRECSFLPADVADVEIGDPYTLMFLGLVDGYSDPNFESALLAELQQALMAFGSDCLFMEQAKRITIDDHDDCIDLLFFHRGLNCLVAVSLKIGELETTDKEAMARYLHHLEKHEQLNNENSPIGLVFCTGENHEHVELLQIDKSSIRAPDYPPLLPPKELLEEQLHRCIERARQWMMLKGSSNDA